MTHPSQAPHHEVYRDADALRMMATGSKPVDAAVLQRCSDQIYYLKTVLTKIRFAAGWPEQSQEPQE